MTRPVRQVSLARALSKLGVTSRSEARRWIEAGRVRVDGNVVRDPERWLEPERSRIEVDGRRIARAGAVVVALHKPAGVVTTRSDERGRRTVYDLLPEELPFLGPVGRLDLESTGLLLLTNDTRLGADLTDPEHGCAKTYEVRLDREFADADACAFARGLVLRDGTRLRPAEVTVAPRDRRAFTITLREGRNRQIRRMCEEMGYRVERLHRVAIGPLRLGTLPEGGWRRLTPAELRLLRTPRG